MCQAARCGDGKVQSGAPLNEECDDANSTADDGCENNCRRSTVIGLAAGAGHSCALLGSGNVRCWGDNVLGQLGIGNDMFRGTTPPYMIPSISLGAAATAIAAGADHTCALLTGGTVRCWGKNNHGQHGQGDATIRLSPSAALAFASPATKISAGGDTTCVVLQSGAVHCWGGNTSGMLGKATTTDICASAGATCLSAVAIGGTASAISVGSNAVCAVLSSGSVICWGGNGFGELGRGDTTVVGDTETPAAAPAPATPVLPAGRTATLIASGSGHNCARLDNGQMECWGLNTAGQLGLGLSSATFAIGDNESPSTAGVTQLMTVSALFASNTSSCAKLVAGGIRCWGNNNKGHLGYPDTANKGGDTATIPSNLANVNFGSGITATTMALGSSHACALLSNGQVRCWGRNNVGQLGNAMTLSGAMDFVGGANMTPDTLPAVQVFPP
jgi:cysteine-rich repeat protein